MLRRRSDPISRSLNRIADELSRLNDNLERQEQPPQKAHWDVKVYKRIIAALGVFSTVATIVAFLVQINVI